MSRVLKKINDPSVEHLKRNVVPNENTTDFSIFLNVSTLDIRRKTTYPDNGVSDGFVMNYRKSIFLPLMWSAANA